MLLPEIEGHQELGKDAVLRAYPDRYKPVPMRALITTSSRPSAICTLPGNSLAARQSPSPILALTRS